MAMKKCPYCGTEYADDLLVCPSDHITLAQSKAAPSGPNFKTTPGSSAADGLRLFLIGAITLTAAFAGVGIAWLVTSTFARSAADSHRDAAVTGNIPLLIIGALLAATTGFLGARYLFPHVARPADAQRELERKYIGPGGFFRVYAGIPIFLIALLSPGLETLIHKFGLKVAPYIGVGICLGIFAACLTVYDRIPKRLIFPLGLLGWVLTFLVACWYAWFGPGAFGHHTR
jgi:hypothetical protein